MRHNYSKLLFVVVLCSICMLLAACASSKDDDIVDTWPKIKSENTCPPKLLPLYLFRAAIAGNNLELFKTVYSKRLSSEFEKEKWPKVLKRYRKAFHDVFGSYVLDGKYTHYFKMVEDGTKIHVTLEYKGMKYPKRILIKEDGQWKFDSR